MDLTIGSSIPLPSIESVGVRARSPVQFFFDDERAMTSLRKIHIAHAPAMNNGQLVYRLIAVFDKFIAILSIGDQFSGDHGWHVLMHSDLAPRSYVDAA